jgi:hypothetical protein
VLQRRGQAVCEALESLAELQRALTHHGPDVAMGKNAQESSYSGMLHLQLAKNVGS